MILTPSEYNSITISYNLPVLLTMFNGYHEPSPTSYNDLELDRGKKNQSASKWTCGNGTGIQSTQLHTQNQQPDVWVSKPSFIELPNSASQKCNCPGCYQLSESQSYQGDMPWHRSWFTRPYPVTVNSSHDLLKLPGNHHWENPGFGNESYSEPGSGQFMQETVDKSLLYKSYSGFRHEIYQQGVISTVKKFSRKQDLPKQDEVMNMGHHPQYSVQNSGYDSYRTTMDQRLIEERTNYCNQNEKFLNAEACRHQGGLSPYGLNPNRRTMLESFSKTVPLNANQNRVPSVEHRNIKDNDFHSYIDQTDIEKTSSHIMNHGGTEDKHCKPYISSDVNLGQENLHSGLMKSFSTTTPEYHPVNLEPAGKDFQKFVDRRNPQQFPRNNISDMINRNQNAVLNYNINRKGVINVPVGSARAAPTPPKHPEMVTKPPNFPKHIMVPDKIPPGQKMMMNNNVKMSPDRFNKVNEISKSENMLHGHMTRPVMETNPQEKFYSPQNSVYKTCRRPQEYSYGLRNIQRPNDYPNGMAGMPVGINMGVPNFPDYRKGLDTYQPRVNNAFPNEELSQPHYQHSGDSKPQYCGTQLPLKAENFRVAEKENPSRISHLEAIPYEELCKNGTSKISPLRLLRKKKLVHQKKEDIAEVSTPDTAANVKSASPPLDVRRFWATWAEEEEENVLQTQMVVLDCHNIEVEQAGLLNFYQSENIRAVNFEEGNVLNMKGDQDLAATARTTNFEDKSSLVAESTKMETIVYNDVKVPVSNGVVEKSQSEYSLYVPLIIDPVKESKPEKETSSNVIVQRNSFKRIVQDQPSDGVKQFEFFGREEQRLDDDRKHSEVESAVLNKGEINRPEGIKRIEAKKEIERCNNDVVNIEESTRISDSSDDSQTGDLPALPDLPTSEYRKNKFLDYPDDNFCNGGFLLENVIPETNEEILQKKQMDDGNDYQVEEKLKDFLATEIGPGNLEIDDILKKFSDINFQGGEIGGDNAGWSDSPDAHKTDKKLLESKRDKKIKKFSHKSSRTDQVTLQNISLAKPTIKFSIQKSHDLKISFKVLNNKKKEDEIEASDEENREDRSVESIEDGEIVERLKKNKRRLITLRLKGVSDGKDDGSLWDEDSARKSKKKKKIRSSSPKTPILKIKKSRYMVSYDSEVQEACNGVTDDTSKSSESSGSTHGDFQVRETVDSAKIKLTFKRNRNGKEKNCEEEVPDADKQLNNTETGSCLKNNVDSPEIPNDHERVTSSEDIMEEISAKPIEEQVNLNDQLVSITRECENSLESGNFVSLPDEPFMDDFKKESDMPDPLDAVQLSGDPSSPKSINGADAVCITECETPENTRKDEGQFESFTPEIDTSSEIRGRFVINKSEDMRSGESEDEFFSILSKSDVVEGSEIKMVKENDEDYKSCVVEKPTVESLEKYLDCKSEQSDMKIDEINEDHGKAIIEDEEKEETPDSTGDYHKNLPLETVEELSENLSQESSIRDNGEPKTVETTKQDEIVQQSEGIQEAEPAEGNDQNETAEEMNLLCTTKEEDRSGLEVESAPKSPLLSNSLQEKEVDSGETENPEPVITQPIEPEENIVALEKCVEEANERIVEVDAEVEPCRIEQIDSEVEQSKTETTETEDRLKAEKTCFNIVSKEISLAGDKIYEENNNNIELFQKQTIFISRKIVRRCSNEEKISEQVKNLRRTTKRSGSLNVELTIADCADPETLILDIAVSDIPLPPGEAPPENCLNLEEYFKSRFKEVEKKAEDVRLVTENPEPIMDSVFLLNHVELPQLLAAEDVNVIETDEKEEGEKEAEREINEEKKEVSSTAAMVNQQTELGKASDSDEVAEIRIEDLEVFETRDTDITLEESSFRTDQLYDCDGLSFDEALTITDDIEQEKVSDDDKFRDMMQNCLDNAKKFLSVGNVKSLQSGDLPDSESEKLDSTQSKSSPTSCEESEDINQSSSRQQSSGTSLDLVSSFCMDAGGNPCSEILPVDNWPYLEEEVASSPIRNKTDESDLLGYSDYISSTENETPKLKNDESSLEQFENKGGHVRERRRTIEGICRWKAFRSSDEELSDVENFVFNRDKSFKRLSPQFQYSRDSGRICRRQLKSRKKPYSDGEGRSRSRSSPYYKSSSWQPRVLLFRISKNKRDELKDAKNSRPGTMSVQKYARQTMDRNWDKTNNHPRRSHIENEVRNGKPHGNRPDGIKRKKNRFRNLHTKKRTVPESQDQTKENKLTADNSSNLVDSESDSDESTPTSDPSKEMIRGHNMSTKSSSCIDEELNRKSRADEVLQRSRRHDSGQGFGKCREKRKREDSKHELESQCKRERSRSDREKNSDAADNSKAKNRREAEKKGWVCEVCGFSKISERAAHIQCHPFHCQSCHLAFKTEANFIEHLTRKHKDIRNQHHCLLCELTFDLEKDYYRHLETREHKHLESVEKNTINTLFKLLTGQPCPVLGPVESKPEWLPSQAGTVHFYHQATPLSLALQYLKLHHDKKKLSMGSL